VTDPINLPSPSALSFVSLSPRAGSEGIEWIKNEPYDNTDGHWGTSAITGTVVPRNKGQYTLKRYHFKSKVPGLLVSLAPANALFLIEEAWNAYPHCKTVLVNGYLSKERLRIDVETMHIDTDIDVANVLNLPAAELKSRTVEYIDIRKAASDPGAKDYKTTGDCTKFKSAKTGRGPLGPGWERAKGAGAPPVMCCYKIVRATCGIFGLQGTVEGAIINSQRNLFTQTLSKAFVTIDEWHGLTIEDIRKMEAEVARRANEQLKETVSKAASMPAVADTHQHHGHSHHHGHGHSHGDHGHSHGAPAEGPAGAGAGAGPTA
jgi:hypothetical protein